LGHATGKVGDAKRQRSVRPAYTEIRPFAGGWMHTKGA
jgi:hypothetical protein